MVCNFLILVFDVIRFHKVFVGPDDSCFLTVWVLSKSALVTTQDRPKPKLPKRTLVTTQGRPKPKLPKRKSIYLSRFSAGSDNRQTSFLEQGNVWKKCPSRAHCKQVPKTHYSPAEHQRPYCKQDKHSSLSCFRV